MATSEQRIYRIRELQVQISDIDEQLLQLESKRESRIQTLRASSKQAFQRHVQSMHIIHKIPFEVLGHIFYFAFKNDRTVIPKVSAVSRAWYSAAVGHPNLWNFIQISGPFHSWSLDSAKEYLDMCYRRSGILPLDIVFTTEKLYKAGEECLAKEMLMYGIDSDQVISQGCSHMRHNCPYWISQAKTALEVFDLLLQYEVTGQATPISSRWRSFYFDWPCHVQMVKMGSPHFSWSLLNRILDNGTFLEDLYIGNSGHDFKSTFVLDGRLRNLRRIELVDEGWDDKYKWQNDPQLPSVKDLTIEWKDEESWPREGHGLGINWMRRFPNLQSLTLRSRSSTLHGDPDRYIVDDAYVNEYPSVERLSLLGYIPTRILRNSHLPNLKVLVITPNHDGISTLFTSNLSKLSVVTAAKSLVLQGSAYSSGFYANLYHLSKSLNLIQEVVVSPQIWEDIDSYCMRHPGVAQLVTNKAVETARQARIYRVTASTSQQPIN